jgi:hypothetical protein
MIPRVGVLCAEDLNNYVCVIEFYGYKMKFYIDMGVISYCSHGPKILVFF